MAAANAILTHTGPDTQKLEGPAALSDASKKQAEHAKEMEEINHKSEKKVYLNINILKIFKHFVSFKSFISLLAIQ